MDRFFAYISRLKLIDRWGLMRSSRPENDAEHSLQTAMLAHGIAVLGRDRYGRDIEPEHILALALYHDVTEVLTGDMPTPVKYASSALRTAYGEVEAQAADVLTRMLPETLRPVFRPYIAQDCTAYEHAVVKAADRISAYIKCVEELRAGNREFEAAGESILASIQQIDLPEVQDFLRDSVPAFALTLDELNRPETGA